MSYEIGMAAMRLERKLRFVVPAEMIHLTLQPDLLERFYEDRLQIDILPANDAKGAV